MFRRSPASLMAIAGLIALGASVMPHNGTIAPPPRLRPRHDCARVSPAARYRFRPTVKSGYPKPRKSEPAKWQSVPRTRRGSSEQDMV